MKRIPRRRRSRSSREQGAGAVDLVVVSAFLLIPTAMLLLSLPLMVEYRSLADAAAREAVRACAIAPDPITGQTYADAIARRILNGRGLSPQGTMVDINCDDAWYPGKMVTARVSFQAPAVSIIGFGNIGAVTIKRTYCERIEHTRSLPTQEHSPPGSKPPGCEQIEQTRSLPP